MSTRLFFGHLAHGTQQRDIEKLLRGFGEIRDMAVLDRYAFVEFRNSEDAKEALREFDGKNFRGERLVVEYAKSRPPRERYGRNNRRGPPNRTDNRLIVRNLTTRANWQDLKDLMRRAGEVAFADAHKERQGEGIIEFEHYDDMKYALEKFQDYDFRGRRLELIDDSRGPSRRGRSRSRSYSRSRSPRRGRSRSRSYSPRRRRRSRSPRRSRRSPSPRRRQSRSPSPRRSASRSPYDRESNRDNHRERENNDHSPRYERSRSHSPPRDDDYSPRHDSIGKEPEDSYHNDDAPLSRNEESPIRGEESPRREPDYSNEE